MDLQEPTKKMSTTGGTPQGTVKLLDEPDVIRKKFRSAVTDSGSEVRRADDKPGVTNLIDILSALTGEAPEAIEARYDGAGYGQFKTDVGEAVVGRLAPIQERYRELRADPGELQRLLARGAEKAREASEPTLDAMFERMGFVRARWPLRRRDRHFESPAIEALGSHGVPARDPGGADVLRASSPPRRGVSSRHSPGASPADVQPRVEAPVQAADAVADRLAHAPHLAVAALVENELEAGGAEAADARRAR